MTSETIYADMVALGIPFECQKWHLNRLIALIRECDRRNRPPKKLSKEEIMKISLEEFSRIQRYMRMADKNSELYEELKERYTELKVILTAFGINVTALDKIKE